MVFYFDIEAFGKRKANQLDAYISLIEHIKNQIECYLLPIDEILLSMDKRLLQACTLKNTEKCRALNEIIDATDFYIDDDSVQAIRAFADGFGQGYRSEQLRSCEYYISQLKKQKEKLKEKISKEKKVQLALCICASISLVIILI